MKIIFHACLSLSVSTLTCGTVCPQVPLFSFSFIFAFWRAVFSTSYTCSRLCPAFTIAPPLLSLQVFKDNFSLIKTDFEGEIVTPPLVSSSCTTSKALSGEGCSPLPLAPVAAARGLDSAVLRVPCCSRRCCCCFANSFGCDC